MNVGAGQYQSKSVAMTMLPIMPPNLAATIEMATPVALLKSKTVIKLMDGFTTIQGWNFSADETFQNIKAMILTQGTRNKTSMTKSQIIKFLETSCRILFCLHFYSLQYQIFKFNKIHQLDTINDHDKQIIHISIKLILTYIDYSINKN